MCIPFGFQQLDMRLEKGIENITLLLKKLDKMWEFLN